MPAALDITANPWVFHPHVEVWALVLVIVGAWFYAVRVIGPKAVAPGETIVTRRQCVYFGATIVLLWAVVRLTFRRTGVGGVLRRMEARPPRSGDLAEQRLANLVQEVAVAAAVPPPRVLLIDTKAANVAAAGLTPRPTSFSPQRHRGHRGTGFLCALCASVVKPSPGFQQSSFSISRTWRR